MMAIAYERNENWSNERRHEREAAEEDEDQNTRLFDLQEIVAI